MDSKLIDHTLESGLIENSELTSLNNDKLNGLKIKSNLADASGKILKIFWSFLGSNFSIFSNSSTFVKTESIRRQWQLLFSKSFPSIHEI
jgi:hypothetical protein